MKNAIYVFSSTGTSLAVATRIGNELGDTKIFSIPNELKNAGENQIKVEADKVGFIFPCFFGEIPAIVREFIERLSLSSTMYTFAVVTAGGNIGYCLHSLTKDLESKGNKLNYGTSVIVSSNYLVAWYYSLICKKGKKLVRAFEMLDYKSSQIAKDVSYQKSKMEKRRYFISNIPKIITPKEIVKDTRKWDREFHAEEKCTGCGICHKVCPVQNIKMINRKPEFQHNCQRCMACMQYCPNNAIRLNNKSLNKPKYFHPAFPAAVMMKFVDGEDFIPKQKHLSSVHNDKIATS